MEAVFIYAKHFALCFIPIFIAIDPFGILPLLIGMMDHVPDQRRKEIITHSVFTAGLIGLGFLFLGNLILKIIGVTVNDFRVAGGLILLILSILDLVTQEKTRRLPGESIGVFPIGTPLIAGPAVLAALMTMPAVHSWPITFAAFLVNLFLVFVLFRSAGKVVKFIGSGGTKAVGKIASLLLAAYGVMLIRSGLEGYLLHH